MMDAIERAVPAPQAEVIMHGASGGQVFGKRAPLAAGAENVHHAVDHLAQIDAALAAAALARRNQRLDMRPFLIAQVARIAQRVTVVAGSVFSGPHRAPHDRKRHPERITFESHVSRGNCAQPVRPTHKVSGRTLSPDDVSRYFEELFTPNHLPIIIIDEYDKISDPTANELMANTIKLLSDFGVNVTVILVGVADNVVELIGEHQSVQRCMEQVLMPRMEKNERREVLTKTIPRLGMNIHSDASWKIVDLSRGLPSYIHALGLYAVQNACARRSLLITEEDVDVAITRAIGKAQEIIRENYAVAVSSNRADTLYKEVLLACALAKTNDRGMFTPQVVCAPLSAILGREVQIPTFQQHLKKFIALDRGEILIRKGRERAYQFRFADPLMQPFVIMKGIEQNLVDPEAMSALSAPTQPELPI